MTGKKKAVKKQKQVDVAEELVPEMSEGNPSEKKASKKNKTDKKIPSKFHKFL